MRRFFEAFKQKDVKQWHIKQYWNKILRIEIYFEAYKNIRSLKLRIIFQFYVI